MYILNLSEVRKVAGYRQIENGEVLLEVSRIPSGFKITGDINGVIDDVELFSFPRPDRVLVNNWQSWGPTRVIDKGFRLDFPQELIQKFGFSASIMPEIYFNLLLSDYFVASDSFVIGALKSTIGHVYFKIDDERISVHLRYFGRKFENWTAIEPIVVLNLGTDVGLPYYAQLVAKENNVDFSSQNPVGWSSWYHYYLDFDYEKMMLDLERSKNLKLGYEVFQIDDAWEVDIGDWVPNEKFPSLREIANKIAEYGYTPGIWLAPFSISETSSVYKEHKEWLVRDENGIPVVAYENWNKKIYALDTTHPEALEWLKNIFISMKESGFDYFKIDFLFAGAIQGKRYLPVSPIEAYQSGLRAIRSAVGNSFILGCGAPLLPSVGLVDGMRIGADTAPFWNASGPDIGYPNAYFAIRNVITRSFMNNVFWWNDPDCLMLRIEDTQLNDKQRELYTLVSVMLDNMVIESDKLSCKIDLNLWDLVKRYKKYGRRVFKVKGIMDGKYKIESCGVNGCDVVVIDNLANAEYSVIFDKPRVELVKDVEKRDDGRTFNYYTERHLEGGESE
jgi:alpha-galactosidase